MVVIKELKPNIQEEDIVAVGPPRFAKATEKGKMSLWGGIAEIA